MSLDSAYSELSGTSSPVRDHARCHELFKTSRTLTYLCHEAVTIRLRKDDGPRTAFRVFGSPYSPRIGPWAFGYSRAVSSRPEVDVEGTPSAITSTTEQPKAEDLWSAIPLNTDVLVTHTPPHSHCDESRRHRAEGCEELSRVLGLVRPRLAVCGHIHEARGAERVTWKIGGEQGDGNTPYQAASAEIWEDPGAGPGNRRISLLDLTSRRGNRALDNDGSCSSPPPPLPPNVTKPNDTSTGQHQNDLGLTPEDYSLAEKPDNSSNHAPGALHGRMGRRETCIVNCAIMAKSYPHVGGKIFNKPIVVDLDLPVWDD